MTKFTLPSQDVLVDNILSLYRLKTSALDIAGGSSWYVSASQLVTGLACEFGFSRARVACALSALSPRNNWENNKSDLRCLLWSLKHETARKAIDTEVFENYKYFAFATNVDKAYKCLTFEFEPAQEREVEELLYLVGKGNKTRAFARLCFNPSLYPDVVCVDTHSISVALGERALAATTNKVFASDKHYSAIARAYVVAAEAAGFVPYQLQAITWLTWKRINNI